MGTNRTNDTQLSALLVKPHQKSASHGTRKPRCQNNVCCRSAGRSGRSAGRTLCRTGRQSVGCAAHLHTIKTAGYLSDQYCQMPSAGQSGPFSGRARGLSAILKMRNPFAASSYHCLPGADCCAEIDRASIQNQQTAWHLDFSQRLLDDCSLPSISYFARSIQAGGNQAGFFKPFSASCRNWKTRPIRRSYKITQTTGNL